MVGECQEGGSREGSIGARTAADCRGDMPDTSLRRKDVCASESANKASQAASFFQRSSQPPALAPRLRVSQGHQLVVGEIVRSLCPKVSESSRLVELVGLVAPTIGDSSRSLSPFANAENPPVSPSVRSLHAQCNNLCSQEVSPVSLQATLAESVRRKG